MNARVTILKEWGGLELFEATFDHPRFPRHAHATYAMGVVHRGVNYFRYRGVEHSAPRGLVCTVTPDETHDVEPKAPHGFAYRCLYPSLDLVRSVAETIARGPIRGTCFLPPVIDDPTLAALVDTVFETTRSRGAELARDTALSALLRRAITRHAQKPVVERATKPPRRAVVLARDYLAAHVSENITLPCLVEASGLDVFSLVRGFRSAYGLPPHAWLVQERVRRAQALLREGLPAARVATAVGFTDQSHLTRCFKRILGVTPGCYSAGRVERGKLTEEETGDAKGQGGSQLQQ